MALRVTQAPLEVLYTATPIVRVTQAVLEVLYREPVILGLTVSAQGAMSASFSGHHALATQSAGHLSVTMRFPWAADTGILGATNALLGRVLLGYVGEAPDETQAMTSAIALSAVLSLVRDHPLGLTSSGATGLTAGIDRTREISFSVPVALSATLELSFDELLALVSRAQASVGLVLSRERGLQAGSSVTSAFTLALGGEALLSLLAGGVSVLSLRLARDAGLGFSGSGTLAVVAGPERERGLLLAPRFEAGLTAALLKDVGLYLAAWGASAAALTLNADWILSAESPSVADMQSVLSRARALGFSMSAPTGLALALIALPELTSPLLLVLDLSYAQILLDASYAQVVLDTSSGEVNL